MLKIKIGQVFDSLDENDEGKKGIKDVSVSSMRSCTDLGRFGRRRKKQAQDPTVQHRELGLISQINHNGKEQEKRAYMYVN